MKVTFILKNLTDAFYDGNESCSIIGLLKRSDSEKFAYLSAKAAKRELDITMKIGATNAFRDRVDLNAILRRQCSYAFKLEHRKGYRLATFDIV